jgi:hypothetical protein
MFRARKSVAGQKRPVLIVAENVCSASESGLSQQLDANF